MAELGGTCMSKTPSRGMNRRDALSLAAHLGCKVSPIKATGEIRIGHPAWDRTIRVNNRRRGVSRDLIRLLTQLPPLRKAV